LIPGRNCDFVSVPRHPDWLLVPPSFLSNSYQGLFSFIRRKVSRTWSWPFISV